MKKAVTALGAVVIALLMTGCKSEGKRVGVDGVVSVTPSATAETELPDDGVSAEEEAAAIDPKFLDHVTKVKECKSDNDDGVSVSFSLKNKAKGDANYSVWFGVYDSAGTQTGTFTVDVTNGNAIHYGDTVDYEGDHGLFSGKTPDVFTCKLIGVDRTAE